ncbi:glycosyltransferase family protein [Methanobacterium ferruginis]|uniref:glycosyltransferase family protein n=1 Tax=Methanobacterium ferruginis TaxID=710191 RepID=UPI00257429F4|nr:glycosyltransferase family protein [Methanobacterium ferruginis]BDZ68985.1 spore coat protein [Methanobacterium ferruginis]
MKTGVIIQARTSSTRLPEKVLKNLPYNTNITVLQQVIRRLKKSRTLDEIIVATTTDEADRKIVDIAEKEEIPFFRGNKENVLERYYLAAKENDLDVVVRITSDCPCIDPDIVDLVVNNHLETNSDYTSNTLIRTFPVGLDVEVINFETLQKCYFNAETDLEREHVTTYIHNNLNQFKTENILLDGPNKSQIRITLDTEEDYALLCVIFDYLYKKDEFFKSGEIMKLFKNKPWLMLINKKIIAKKHFESFEDEFNEALRVLELQELNNVKKLLQSIKTNKSC